MQDERARNDLVLQLRMSDAAGTGGPFVKLYVNRVATTSRAVLAFCQAEGIPVAVEEVDLMKGEHHQPPFSELNPNRLVPVLDDDGFVLTEASAILRYLAGKTNSRLYPTELKARARVDEVIAWFEANFYRDFGFGYVYPQVLPHHARGSDEITRATVEWGREKSRTWLTVLDRNVLKGSDGWLVGDRLSIADYFGASILSLGELVKCTFDGYPNVRRWYDQVLRDASWAEVNAPFQGFAASLRGRSFVELS
jgi:glutathione S-transferase